MTSVYRIRKKAKHTTKWQWKQSMISQWSKHWQILRLTILTTHCLISGKEKERGARHADKHKLQQNSWLNFGLPVGTWDEYDFWAFWTPFKINIALLLMERNLVWEGCRNGKQRFQFQWTENFLTRIKICVTLYIHFWGLKACDPMCRFAYIYNDKCSETRNWKWSFRRMPTCTVAQTKLLGTYHGTVLDLEESGLF